MPPPAADRAAFRAYALATAGYLAVQSLPLLLTPTLLITLLVPEPRRMTDLETYLSRTLGLTLLGLAAVTLVAMGVVVPASTATDETSADGDPTTRVADAGTAVATAYHLLTAIYVYTQFMQRWSVALGLGMAASGALVCFGGWLMLFGKEKARVSATTGADKRTSNFPFENKESAREKKKDSKRKSLSRGK